MSRIRLARIAFAAAWIVGTALFALAGDWKALGWLSLIAAGTHLVVWYLEDPGQFRQPVRLRLPRVRNASDERP